jgi:hypothetical protein
MLDEIVYIVYSKPGGVDGMDHTDKGGTIVRATTEKAAAEKFVGQCHGWYEIKPEVHDLEEVAKATLAKLTKLEHLSLTRYPALIEKRFNEGFKK